MKTGVERADFWDKFQYGGPDECWPWTGSLDSGGYGRFSRKSVHRMVYEFFNGPIPHGLLVRHTCDNRPCGNPAHLLTGTHADNSRDACERNRNWRCIGINNGNAKLTDEQVAFIRANPHRQTQRDLARQLGVAQSTIGMIRSGQRRGGFP